MRAAGLTSRAIDALPILLAGTLRRGCEAAALIRARNDLGIGGAVLICNPVTEDLAIDIDTIENWIEGCIHAAPPGAAATPWLLAEIARRSDGRSLAANKRLIIDNAGLAGAIAAAL